jgi:hypothetical protein
MLPASAASWLFEGVGKSSPATMYSEFDMRAPLFPKEQVPASTPSPREVGTILFGMMAFCRCGASIVGTTG